MRFIISFIILCTALLPCRAQQPVYIDADAKVWNFGNVAVTGDMTNNGLLGSSPNSNLYFYGMTWTNGFTASLRDESTSGLTGTGGYFRFHGINGRQTIAGGFNVGAKMGASFPNIEINNPEGVIFGNLHDLKIRNILNLSDGMVILNGQNLMLGDATPGTITGYSDKRYIVTGETSTGGFLYRAKLTGGSGSVVFPVGSSENSYTPASILYEGAAEDFHARVFNGVYTYASSGTLVLDSVVYKTWNIGQELGGTGKVAVTLQHMDTDEGTEYGVNRDKSYISLFKDSEWERRINETDNMSVGEMSTEAMSASATTHTRGFAGIGLNTYFIKKINYSASYTPATIIDFNAYRVGASKVDLVWTTQRESNHSYFDIERRLDNETVFTKVGAVPTKAENGNSTAKLNYYAQDKNDYDGWSYYRIKVVSKTGKYVYSDVREVGPLITVTVFPNPNKGDFKVRVKGIKTTLTMQLYDVWGQVLRKQDITREGMVEIHNMPTGTYFLILKHKDTQKEVYTTKVIVIDH